MVAHPVTLELSPHGVADATLQTADGLFGYLAGSELVSLVVPAGYVVADPGAEMSVPHSRAIRSSDLGGTEPLGG